MGSPCAGQHNGGAGGSNAGYAPNMRIILATSNAHKLEEVRAMFADGPTRWSASINFQRLEIPEPFDTMQGNAITRRRRSEHTGLPTVADDSESKSEPSTGPLRLLKALDS